MITAACVGRFVSSIIWFLFSVFEVTRAGISAGPGNALRLCQQQPFLGTVDPVLAARFTRVLSGVRFDAVRFLPTGTTDPEVIVGFD